MGHGALSPIPSQYCVGFGISWLRQAGGAGGEMEAGVEFCLPCLPCLPCKSYAVLSPQSLPIQFPVGVADGSLISRGIFPRG